MTWTRLILVLLALLALADGAVYEAIGIAVVVVVLAVRWPRGAGRRPVPIRMWFPGGRWNG